jgi:hypothetical protein
VHGFESRTRCFKKEFKEYEEFKEFKEWIGLCPGVLTPGGLAFDRAEMMRCGKRSNKKKFGVRVRAWGTRSSRM